MRSITRIFLTLVLALLLTLNIFAASNTKDGYVEIDGAQFVCLNTVLQGSDIQIKASGGDIQLSEDGLTLQLSTGSVFAKRQGYGVAAMRSAPVVKNGDVYVHADFYEQLLGENGAQQPSLFHGMLFFPGEVLNALDKADDSPFRQKLLNEVLLPTSMQIEAPHVDMGRIFSYTPLSNYPPTLTQELQRLGYRDAASLTYSEYSLASGAQSVREAGLADSLQRYPALADVNPDEMTVSGFTQWQREKTQQDAYKALSESEQAYLADKKITFSDYTYLKKLFYNDVQSQPDSALRAALEAYYQSELSYLREMRNPFSDVSSDDWFFEAAILAYERGVMYGSGNSHSFQPNGLVTRGQLVTMLYRLAGSPAASRRTPYRDVAQDAYYAKAVSWGHQHKIINGTAADRFDPDGAVTREQMISILWRCANEQEADTGAEEAANLTAYRDAAEISEYAIEAMQWACENDLVKGAGNHLLHPKDAVTRAEVAAILQRLAENEA